LFHDNALFVRLARVASTSRYSASMHVVPFEAWLCFA
jgi:hypothetical protein